MPQCYIPNYPRPQFVRREWTDLNGDWRFAFDDGNVGEEEKWCHRFPGDKVIQVPFTYETKASEIGEETFHRVVWYQREIPGKRKGQRALLHFEGSDYKTRVWVNGGLAGEHTGGYARFSLDITDLLENGTNTLTVRVEDTNDLCQPRGKQRWRIENFSCFYVQTTGIWKPVWMEYINPLYLARVKMTPDLDEAALQVEWTVSRETLPEDLMLKASVSFQGRDIGALSIPVNRQRGKFSLPIADEELSPDGLKVWSPETPDLYDIRFELSQAGQKLDTVESYFGMRTVAAVDGQVLLNGRPYYQRLVLDQGYWKDSHLTPPDEEALITDIEKAKAFGFNGARKHQKVEDERYYYWCDVKGFLVWSEMPSPFVYRDDTVERFMAEWEQIVRLHYNHPCVITWTPVNESWGVPRVARDRMQQHFTEAVYHLTKALDSTRPVIVNDGWEHTVSDIITLHDYEEDGDIFYRRYSQQQNEILENRIWHNHHRRAFAQGYGYQGQPVLISEYGGAAYDGHGSGDWGYGGAVKTEEDMLKRIGGVTSAIQRLPYVCGYCYTQLTDVQQEINGLLTADREYKVDPDKARKLFSAP